MTEIAKEFGCHRTTVCKYLKENGIKPTSHPDRLKIKPERFASLYNDGKSTSEIAEILNVSLPTVIKYLRKDGVMS